MRRLSNEEREIRRSAGIPFWRLLPFLLSFIAIIAMSSDQQLFEQCIGRPLEGTKAVSGWIRILVAIPCSPHYVRDFSSHWIVIAMFCVGVVLSIPQILWLKQHAIYWNAIREKEKLKRAEKANQKKIAREGGADIDQ